MPVTIDLDTYREQAEDFVSAVDREYYLHFSGQKADFEIEAIYESHHGLFSRAAVDELRAKARTAAGEDRRRLGYLLELAVGGHIGQATKAQAAELARRESTIELDVDGDREPYRHADIRQANEPEQQARAHIDHARLEALDRELNPLLVEMTQAAHDIAVDLGWESYLAMYSELKGCDLVALEGQTSAFCRATSGGYRETVEPALHRQLGLGFDDLLRSDLPRFFRAPDFDRLFPAGRLVEAFERTLLGLGIDVRAQPEVTLDLEPRPRKSPRAFCAPVHVPNEVYLVMPLAGGREDYAALLHEGGHTEHYANVEAALPFEFRHLGDNSVTESFAFLFEHLTEDAAWLESVLGAGEAGEYMEFVRAAKLIFLRRYSAKLSYELVLHGPGTDLAEMPPRYAGGLGDAVGVDWPQSTYLADVDEGFYAASYLRAWALETHWRAELRGRFGERWFERSEAGDFLLSLWSQGQRLPADELLAETTGETLDFGVMAGEVA